MRKVILVVGLVGLFLAKTSEGYAADIEAVLDDNAGASEFVVQDSDTSQVFGVSSDGDVTVVDDAWIGIGSAAERIQFDSDGDDIELMGGNVGIGTTEPNVKLDIRQSEDYEGIRIYGFDDQAAKYATMGINPWGSFVFSSNSNINFGPAGYAHFYPGTNFYFRIGDNGFFYIDDYSGSVNYFTVLESNGNVGIGTTSPGGSSTAGTAVLSLADGTAPAGGVASQSSLYSASGELYAFDSGGNATLLSPHDQETGEWIFYSKNTKTGRVVRVDMERMVKAIERVTGEQFMVETYEELGALQ